MKKIIPILTLTILFFGCDKKSIFTIIEYKDVNKKTNLVKKTMSYIPDDNAKYQLGQGFNSATNEVMGNVIKYNNDSSELVTVNDSKGQTTTYDMQRISTLEDLYKFMSLDVTASLGYGAFSGSGRLQILESHTYNSFTDYLAIKIHIENPTKMLKTEVLTDEALKRCKEGQEDFLKYAGNEFIYGIVTGGEAIAIYEFQSKDESDRKSMQLDIDASVKTFFASADMSVSFKNAMSSLSKYKSTKCHFYRRGDTAPIPQDADSLINYLTNFPKVIKNDDSSSVLYYLTKPIKYVQNLPKNNRDFLPIYNQSITLKAKGLEMLKLLKYKGDIKYAKENFEQFEPATTSKLEEKESIIDEKIKAINSCVSKCIFDFTYCDNCKEEILKDSDYKLQRKNFIDNPPIPQPDNNKVKVIVYDNNPKKLESEYLFTVDNGISITLDIQGNQGFNGICAGEIPGSSDEPYSPITIQLKNSDNEMFIEEIQYKGQPIVINKMKVKVYLRTRITEHGNGQFGYLNSCPKNPLKIIYW